MVAVDVNPEDYEAYYAFILETGQAALDSIRPLTIGAIGATL